jgi:hypothetical protein
MGARCSGSTYGAVMGVGVGSGGGDSYRRPYVSAVFDCQFVNGDNRLELGIRTERGKDGRSRMYLSIQIPPLSLLIGNR